jgi:hypothetical protein
MQVKKRTSSPVLWIIAMFLSSLCGLFGILSSPQTQTHQKVSAAPANTQQAKVVCPMEWTSPVSSMDAGEMPATGSVSFDWTDHPAANDYAVTVFTPNGSSVNYDVDGSSKELFLENFTQLGDYKVIITALGSNGTPLCSIGMNFSKSVVTADPAEHVKKENEGEEPSSVIPSNPVQNPAPTEVEIH